MWHMCILFKKNRDQRDVASVVHQRYASHFAYIFTFNLQINLKEKHYSQLQFAD